MKLFNKTKPTEKNFSIKVRELYKTLHLTVVDSESGEFIADIADIADISEEGIYLHHNAADCLKVENYIYNKNMFESNGSLKIIRD